jgi:hypothetical protein
MLKIGDYNTLKISRFDRGGCYLETGEAKQAEVYLPKRETPEGTRPGDRLKVFIYNESKDRLGASTGMPLARVGEFAALRVKDVTSFGAFLDWGIAKDLFVPRKFWNRPLHKDETVVVYLKLDYEQWGVMGTCQFDNFLSEAPADLRANQEISLLIFSKTRLGFEAVLDGRYRGLLYHDEIFEPLKIGDRKTGFIKKIREDGLVDVSLRPQGFRPAADMAGEIILKALRKEGGVLPLHDKSSPREIYDHLRMSKKLFKKTVGVLYREGTIKIREDGIELLSEKASGKKEALEPPKHKGKASGTGRVPTKKRPRTLRIRKEPSGNG